MIKDGRLGYLPLEQMDNEAVESNQQWMPRFNDTEGLVVDVRDNGGGSRRALLELAAYLMTADDEPRIANACRYRLARKFDKHHLSRARYVYRIDSAEFDDRDRKAIKEFQKSFRPEWTHEEKQFSDWHFLVLAKSKDDSRFHYDKPVVILMDEGCFSATDIFLGAFKGWPNVTLVGAASGGGSARSQDFDLPNSNLEIVCASMISFQPDGKLYDTNGIQPDVRVVRPPEYYLIDHSDLMLDKAIENLIGK